MATHPDTARAALRAAWRVVARALGAALVVVLLAACSRSAPDATPEGAVRLFLERMEDAQDDAQKMRAVYNLLGPDARENIAERAQRTGRAQGRRVEPHEVLAEGRFALHFRPKRMTSKATGPGTATVEVEGSTASERAEVRCVKEGASWRIEPELPEPPPIVKRSDEPAPTGKEGRPTNR